MQADITPASVKDASGSLKDPEMAFGCAQRHELWFAVVSRAGIRCPRRGHVRRVVGFEHLSGKGCQGRYRCAKGVGNGRGPAGNRGGPATWCA